MIVFTEYDGYISAGGDILRAKMTITDAKRKAVELPDCLGFCLRGAATSEAVEVIFKSKWEVPRRSSNKWTSFYLSRTSQEAAERQATADQEAADRAATKAKAEANAAEAKAARKKRAAVVRAARMKAAAEEEARDKVIIEVSISSLSGPVNVSCPAGDTLANLAETIAKQRGGDIRSAQVVLSLEHGEMPSRKAKLRSLPPDSTLAMAILELCAACRGYGVTGAVVRHTSECSSCRGKGEVEYTDNWDSYDNSGTCTCTMRCRDCGGSGSRPVRPRCNVCAGSGLRPDGNGYA
jgi:hypothetical protein